MKGIKESKQISEEKREEWFVKIQEARKLRLVDYWVTMQSEKVIDEKGISFAIKKALECSIKKLELYPTKVLVLLDGGLKAPAEYINQKTIIKGDAKEQVIALASICAKVTRDRKMNKLAKKYPEYGFEVHKGYGTKGHYIAIDKYGLLALHRRSFCKRFVPKAPSILQKTTK